MNNVAPLCCFHLTNGLSQLLGTIYANAFIRCKHSANNNNNNSYMVAERRKVLPSGESTRSVCPGHMQQCPPVPDL